jgi:ABC-type transport system substrate-binding protein
MAGAVARGRIGAAGALGAIAAVVAALIAVPGVALPADLRPLRPSTVTVGLYAMPAGIDPLRTADQYSADIEALLYDPLYDRTPQGTYAPDLAVAWHAEDGGRTYVYRLTRRARWSDGRPVSASDVVWSLDAYRSAADLSPVRALLGDIADVTALAPDRVVVRLRAPSPAWPAVLAGLPILPAPSAANARARGQPPPTDGPYRLARWDATAGAVALTANPTYFRGAPHVAELVFRVFADPQDAFAALRRGTLQVAWLPAAYLAPARALSALSVRVVPSPALDLIAFRVDRAPLAQAAVRHALTLATDRRAVARRLWGSLGVVPAAPWPPLFAVGRGPAVAPVPYDPARAAADLAAAGWRMGPDGVRHRQGKALRFTLLAPAGAPRFLATMSMVVASWRRLGVGVTLIPVPLATLQAAAASGRFEALAAGLVWGAGVEAAALIAPPASAGGIENIAGYRDGRVDRLLASAPAGSLPAGRSLAALIRRVQGDAPYLPLAAGASVVVTSATLAGFVANPFGPDVYQPQTWILR